MSKKNLSDDSTAKADIEPSASTPLRESPRLGSLAEGTPLAYAIEANQNLEVSKFSKFLRKVKADKRPALKHLNLARKNKKQQRHFSRQFKGKVIDGQHELYILTYGMMLGLRCAVGRNITEEADLTLDDFCYVEKLNFPPLGYNGERQAATPPHKLAHTFKFKTYSPLVFRRIRTYFNIDPVSFTQSVCGNSNFIEFISNSMKFEFKVRSIFLLQCRWPLYDQNADY